MGKQEDKKLEIGDLVRLKSGGPLMTVNGFSLATKGMCHCSWFGDLNTDADQSNTFHSIEVFKDALDVVTIKT